MTPLRSPGSPDTRDNQEDGNSSFRCRACHRVYLRKSCIVRHLHKKHGWMRTFSGEDKYDVIVRQAHSEDDCDRFKRRSSTVTVDWAERARVQKPLYTYTPLPEALRAQRHPKAPKRSKPPVSQKTQLSTFDHPWRYIMPDTASSVSFTVRRDQRASVIIEHPGPRLPPMLSPLDPQKTARTAGHRDAGEGSPGPTTQMHTGLSLPHIAPLLSVGTSKQYESNQHGAQCISTAPHPRLSATVSPHGAVDAGLHALRTRYQHVEYPGPCWSHMDEGAHYSLPLRATAAGWCPSRSSAASPSQPQHGLDAGYVYYGQARHRTQAESSLKYALG
ncbi:unnamed protein product [Mycena citricolor]|uniref:C2H2-type domain-containing protein n=1 Tax=Mycena citricolor TaxID=2018698 RepID=A0AAD2H6B4_9AGAR|nr:unnamed protein product [Mycena citricolor]